MVKSEAELIREMGDRLSAINEKPGTTEDVIKRAIKDLKRIDPQAMFRTRDLQKAVFLADKGDVSSAAEHLVKGIEGPTNQIQDVFNDINDSLNRIVNPPSAQDKEDDMWADVDDDRARNRIGEAGGYYTKDVFTMIEKVGVEKVMRDLLEFLDADAIQAFVAHMSREDR